MHTLQLFICVHRRRFSPFAAIASFYPRLQYSTSNSVESPIQLYYTTSMVPPFPVKSDVILHFSGIMKKWIIMMMILRLAGKIKTFKIQGLNPPHPPLSIAMPCDFYFYISETPRKCSWYKE